MMFPDFNDPACSEQGHYTDFPEYGKQCDIITPWCGYRRGSVVGRNGYRFIIELTSGARIELYDDEIEFD